MSSGGPTKSFWFRLGLTSFGGPMAQVAALEQECVRRRGWLTSAQFTRAFGLCCFLPGPEAQQLVAWLAWRAGGVREAWLASLLFVGPGWVCCGVLAAAYATYGQLPTIAGALDGARAAVAGVIVATTWRLGRGLLGDASRLVAAGAASLALLAGAPFALLALLAALYGWFLHPASVGAPKTVSSSLRSAGARLLVSLLPFAACLLVLYLVLGARHGVFRLAEVSFVAVLGSFGGAYAALGLWRQRIVGEFGWMSELRFGDALVIGEGTPGPLLLAGSFIGCVAGFQGHLGLGGGWVAGLVGLVIPLVFTFGPSTLVLLATAPLAEEGVDDPRFRSMLGMVTAVASAAVLALGFSMLRTQPATPGLMVISLVSALILAWRGRVVPLLIALGAALGWLMAPG